MARDEGGEGANIQRLLASLIGEELAKALGNLGENELVLEGVEISADELELIIQPPAAPKVIPKPEVVAKPRELLAEKFEIPKMEWTGSVVEVKLGATRSEGGTRGNTIIIGGEKAPAFYTFIENPKHRPAISLDIFDTKIRLAKAVRLAYQDVLDNPPEWARMCVEKYGADMVNLHLVSIDPLIEDTPPSKAAETVAEVLEAVSVPLCIGGCGDPVKDLKVFKKIAEDFKGERLLINSVTLDMDIAKAGKIIGETGHAVIAFTSMDLNHARELNRKLYDYVPKDSIVMDTTTAALGYGLDYAFTIMERARLAALMGDEELQHPISSGSTNAWAAREAWKALPPQWGDKLLRGPLWESITALTLLLAGVDFFMMMHPTAAKTVRTVIDSLSKRIEEIPKDVIYDWITAEV